MSQLKRKITRQEVLAQDVGKKFWQTVWWRESGDALPVVASRWTWMTTLVKVRADVGQRTWRRGGGGWSLQKEY